MMCLTYAEIRAEDTWLDDPERFCCDMDCDKPAQWCILWQEKNVAACDTRIDSCTEHLGEMLEDLGWDAYLVYRLDGGDA